MFMKKFGLMAATAISLVAASQASATVLVEGTIFWGAGTPTTAYSKTPGQSQFSFILPNPIQDPTSAADVSDFSFTLNGTPVSGTFLGIDFWPAANKGLFDIKFADLDVSLYGDDWTGGYPAPGFYTFTAGLNGGAATAAGGLAISYIPDAVPEPASWAMMIGGLGLVGGMMRRSNRKVAIAFG